MLERAILDYFSREQQVHREAAAYFRKWQAPTPGSFRFVCEALSDKPVDFRNGVRHFIGHAVRRGGGLFPAIPDEKGAA